jgi:hypothetical protein
MKQVFITITAALCVSATSAYATCTIVANDISSRLSSAFDGRPVITSTSTDPYSNEPIRRYVTVLESGDVLVLDQRHCEIMNVVATVFSQSVQPDRMPVKALSAAIMATPEWQDHLHAADLDTQLRTVAATLDVAPIQSLTAWAEAINPSADVMVLHSTNDIGAPFSAMTSIVVGIGGL